MSPNGIIPLFFQEEEYSFVCLYLSFCIPASRMNIFVAFPSGLF